MLTSVVLAAWIVMGQASASQSPALAVAPFDANPAKQHQEDWAKHQNAPEGHAASLGFRVALEP